MSFLTSDTSQFNGVVDTLAATNSMSAPAQEGLSMMDTMEQDVPFVAGCALTRKIREQIESVSLIDMPVLIIGEHGTGKEAAARLIHKLSARAQLNLVRVNCDSESEELLDAHLFGCQHGEDGTSRIEPGAFERAGAGCILLRQFSQIPAGVQAKLLHVVQEQAFFPKGSDQRISTRARILATADAKIENAVREKKIREDLFYRVSAFTIEMPPLRARKEELPLLLAGFMDRATKRYNRSPRPFSANVIEACQQYEWPGNLRELENFVQRYLIMGAEVPKPADSRGKDNGLFLVSTVHKGNDWDSHPRTQPAEGVSGLKSIVRNLKGEAEMNAISSALQQTQWNRRQAARLLNISYRGLLYKIREYQLTPSAPSPRM